MRPPAPGSGSPGSRPGPGEERLREAGLSRNKLPAIRNLAEKAQDRTLSLRFPQSVSLRKPEETVLTGPPQLLEASWREDGGSADRGLGFTTTSTSLPRTWSKAIIWPTDFERFVGSKSR